MTQRFDRITILVVAANVPADPRTVRRELEEPGSVRGLIGDRIRRELAKREERLAQSREQA